uniref:Uncharacterized protein n=1 Tax=Meloidogyne incognita TaxID=6306 RepID=A0A914N2B5_MELIC
MKKRLADTQVCPEQRNLDATAPSNASAESGVSSAGLTITVHPAAKAAPILREIIAHGKFH